MNEENKLVRCIRCGYESDQLAAYSVNPFVESGDNKNLLAHKQKCPNCGYEAYDISIESKYDINVEDNVPREVYGIADVSKYDIKPEDNVPQKVYGIMNPNKVGEKVFEAFIGGYGGPSTYYYIYKVGDNYKAKHAFSRSGAYIADDSNALAVVDKTEDEIMWFADKLSEKMANWDNSYVDKAVLDGTQWEIKGRDDSTKYYGSNAYPENFGKVMAFIDDFFQNKSIYEMDPEDNVPQFVYGTPDFMRERAEKAYLSRITCPYCGKQGVWQILYGEPTYDYDKERYVLGGCIVTGHDPMYKCKNCNKDIYREEIKGEA